MCCREDFNRVSDRLLCYLSKGPLKRKFLDIYLTISFEIRKFKNTSTVRVISLWQMFEIQSIFKKI